MAEKFGLDAGSVDNFSESVENATAALEEYIRVKAYADFAEAHGNSNVAKAELASGRDALYGSAVEYDSFTSMEWNRNDTVAGLQKQIAEKENRVAKLTEELKQYISSVDYFDFAAEDILSGKIGKNELEAKEAVTRTDRTLGHILSGTTPFDDVEEFREEISNLQAEAAVLNAEILKIESAAKEKIQNAAQVAVADALNPEAFSDLSLTDLFNLQEFFAGMDFTGDQWTWGAIQEAVTAAATNYDEAMRNAIEKANENIGAAEIFGMSEALYQAMLADAEAMKGTAFEGIDFGYDEFIKSFEEQRSEAIKALGSEDMYNDFVEKGYGSQRVLAMISSGMEQINPGDHSGIRSELLDADTSEMSEDTMLDFIAGVFEKRGVEIKRNVAELEAILKAANQTIAEKTKEIALQKLANTGYQEIFDQLVGGGDIASIAFDAAKKELGEGSTTEAVAAYAEEIVKAFASNNQYILQFIDSETGKIKEGYEGYVDAISNVLGDSDVSGVFAEIATATTATDARSAVGDYISSLHDLADVQKSIEKVKDPNTSLEEQAALFDEIGNALGFPIKTMEEFEYAESIVQGRSEEMNKELDALVKSLWAMIGLNPENISEEGFGAA